MFKYSSYDSSHISWRIRSDRPSIFSCLLLLVFLQKCHTSGQYPKFLLIKLLQMTILDFKSRYFKILAKALSFWTALRQQALICSLKLNQLVIMTPMDFIDVSDLMMEFSSNFNSISSASLGYDIINWNLSRFTFITFLCKFLPPLFIIFCCKSFENLTAGAIKKHNCHCLHYYWS